MDHSHDNDASADLWAGWQGTSAHPYSPSGSGGPGGFKKAGSLGGSLGSSGTPHPQAPSTRYLAAAPGGSVPVALDLVSVVEENGIFFVTLSGLAAMRTFLRTVSESFETTVRRVAKRSKLAVVINGNMYRVAGGKTRILATPVLGATAGKDTTPEGIVRGRGEAIGGESSPKMFYIAWKEGSGYSFGFGDPPADSTSALGGLGPVLIGGQKYGTQNEYRAGVPDGAPVSGEPPPQYKSFLQVRSNATYKSFAERGPEVGKVILGYGGKGGGLHIIVQPNGISGTTLDELRDRLAADGVSDAVFLDGSDSAMLFANDRFYVHQGYLKDHTNTIGVGFQLFAPVIDVPGRSWKHLA